MMSCCATPFAVVAHQEYAAGTLNPGVVSSFDPANYDRLFDVCMEKLVPFPL